MTITKKSTIKKKSPVKKKPISRKKTAVKKKATVNKAIPAVVADDSGVTKDEQGQSVIDQQKDSLVVETVSCQQDNKESKNEAQDMTDSKQQDVVPQEAMQQSDVHASHKAVFDLGNELTIVDVEAKKIELKNMIADAVPIAISAVDIERVDGAGLQLLAAFFKEARKKNVEICWEKVSPMLLSSVKVMGLVEILKMQEVIDDGEGTAWGAFLAIKFIKTV